MIYHFSLKAVALTVGILLILTHLAPLFAEKPVQGFLRRLPRSKALGMIFLAIAAFWTYWLIGNMNMGEFSKFRPMIFVAIPVGYFLIVRYVDEFLSVRALAILALFAAEPLLCAAFLHSEPSKIFVTALAYVWIILGLTWTWVPYLLRDQITWVTANALRWRGALGAGIAYGALLVWLGATSF